MYYLVEQRVLRMKLRFSAEKEVLDLRTGKMVQVDQIDQVRSPDRVLMPEELGGPDPLPDGTPADGTPFDGTPGTPEPSDR